MGMTQYLHLLQESSINFDTTFMTFEADEVMGPLILHQPLQLDIQA